MKLDAKQTGKNEQGKRIGNNTSTANKEDSGEKGLADAQEIGPFAPATTVLQWKRCRYFRENDACIDHEMEKAQ
jgi:hypothetical protein